MNNDTSGKYIFFGTPRFAEVVLEQLLLANMPPVALVCNPDRPVGRKKIMTAPPTKPLVQNKKIAILQPEKLDEDFIKQLRAFDADFFVVAAYGKIIPQAVLDVPRLGVIGVHPSLLPHYRGASPIQTVLLKGETQTGVTLYKMDAGMDSGPIISKGPVDIDPNDDYASLEEKLGMASAQALRTTIPHLDNGELKPQPQDAAAATFTKKFTTQDGFIENTDLEAAEDGEDEMLARTLCNKIRALSTEPGCWTMRYDKRVKLLKAELKDGKLHLLRTQVEGEKAKDVA